MTRRLKLPNLQPTPEQVYVNRRQFIQQLGLGTIAVTGGMTAWGCQAKAQPQAKGGDANMFRPGVTRPSVLAKFPAQRNEQYLLDTALTDQKHASSFNNFYEFHPNRAGPVWKLIDEFEPDPWTIEVSGLCHKPRTFDIDQMFAFAQEERTYRFRCVEAWAMDVPWTGFELSQLLKAVEPKSDAKFVRFTTVQRPAQMPGMRDAPYYPWPYFEALRMDEAMHPLTMMVTGIYGKPLPRQHGAPFRIIVPWKYGYKSPKSIVKIELLGEQPDTFWHKQSPNEYPFESNVEPHVPHPRWSQSTERMLGTNLRRPTQIYNGYGSLVDGLYA